jgi:hypothetical protein
MALTRRLFLLSLLAILLHGCASAPAARTSYEIPLLEDGMSRAFITAGKMQGFVKLWSEFHVGPVLVDGQQVVSTAKNEYIVVGFQPGTYEIACEPVRNDKVYIDKRSFTFKPSEKRFFACDMAQKGLGMSFGLIGVLASEYLLKMWPEERDIDTANSRPVSYIKL